MKLHDALFSSWARGTAISAVRSALIILIAVAVLTLGTANGATLESAVEYRVKAAYIFNFTKFVEWPPRAFTAQEGPLVVGVLERDATVTDTIAEILRTKRTPSGRAIEVRRMTQLCEKITECHLLFVTRESQVSPAELLEFVGERPVLLVGESDEFAQRGGAINFVLAGDTVRFEVNLRRAERAGLKLSGALASVARLVRDKESAR